MTKTASSASRLLAAALTLVSITALGTGVASACTVTVGTCVTDSDGDGTSQSGSGGGNSGSPSGGQAEQPSPPPPPPADPPPAPPAADQHGESRLLELVNRERAAHGLTALALHSGAGQIAREHSFRMAEAGTVFHNDAYFSDATRAALPASLLGENVAYNSSIDDAHVRLMASPKHRENILDPRFTAIGLGVVTASSGSHYVTEAFLRSAAPATPSADSGPAFAGTGPGSPREPGADGSGAEAPSVDIADGVDGSPRTGPSQEPTVEVRSARSSVETMAMDLPDGGAGGFLGVAPVGEWAGSFGFMGGVALLAAAAAVRRVVRRAAELA